ncbi:hypothetical protein J4476_01365 [Candidatus Woesearchaeota archaeon]|nr:MAG: hypothetical protein QT09_C0006G0065 [archaeon GW2011_AR18]MBS3161327.1 hypothetical protein [Candidatus Woesearchaeota archaeon]HIH26282.1 hypothetical protein [Nanoarchaeota archaeon]
MVRCIYAYTVEKLYDNYIVYFPDVNGCEAIIPSKFDILGVASTILGDHLSYLLKSNTQIPNPKYKPRPKTLDNIVDITFD